MNCKNLFSYPDGTVFTGQEILDFINYHTTHNTGKTKIDKYMQKKFGNLNPDMNYKFFKRWIRNHDENNNWWSVDCVDKPRILRVDHTSPIEPHWDWLKKEFYPASYEGLAEIRYT